MDKVVTEYKHGRPLTFSYLVLELFFSLYLINSIDSNPLGLGLTVITLMCLSSALFKM